MSKQTIFQAIGLMSGTSLDGIDVALLETNGCDYVVPKATSFYEYEDSFRKKLQQLLKLKQNDEAVEQELTYLHIQAVNTFLKNNKINKNDIDVIGFHGQTIIHKPGENYTLQIGDGKKLVQKTGIDVVYRLRNNDIVNKGQGAPLVPIFHQAITQKLPLPVAVLNIGGVANITYIDDKGEEGLMAFDTGPGNAMINDVVVTANKGKYDAGGKIAYMGKVHDKIVKRYLELDYFTLAPPKSLDRNYFPLSLVESLEFTDKVATLTSFAASAIARAMECLPQTPKQILLTGGGRHNNFLVNSIESKTAITTYDIKEATGFDGESLEAYAFAYLAVRSILNLPITFPGTTGVKKPLSGGEFIKSGQHF